MQRKARFAKLKVCVYKEEMPITPYERPLFNSLRFERTESEAKLFEHHCEVDVSFGPWEAVADVYDLLHCIVSDLAERGITVDQQCIGVCDKHLINHYYCKRPIYEFKITWWWERDREGRGILILNTKVWGVTPWRTSLGSARPADSVQRILVALCFKRGAGWSVCTSSSFSLLNGNSKLPFSLERERALVILCLGDPTVSFTLLFSVWALKWLFYLLPCIVCGLYRSSGNLWLWNGIVLTADNLLIWYTSILCSL